MAVLLPNDINGNTNLFGDNTLYLLQDFFEVLDNDDDGIDIFASGTELIIRGTVGSDTLNGINVNSGQTANSIVIATTGIVSGQQEGIEVNGEFTNITNNGKILGVDDGVDLVSDNNVVNNFGEIVGRSQGIDATGSGGHEITNDGQIVGNAGEGIFLGGDDNSVTNSSNGLIVGSTDGVFFSSNNNELVNHGEIVGDDDGVVVNGDNNEILNSGEISAGTGQGIDVNGTDNRVVNTGEIVSLSSAAVMFTTAAGEANSLFNSGTIGGADVDGNAIVGGDGQDTIVNQGTIDGNVSLGGGDDFFNGTGGTVFGVVLGGTGDDLYIVDDPTLTLIEEPGEGTDTVTANTGWTLGSNFENLNLVGDGDHTGVGNNLANVINGNIGDNTINGGGGDDLLRGNDGNDTLYGALGDDRLVSGPGDDTAAGGSGDDVVLGGAGDDNLFGGNGDDRIVGGPGNDRMVGGRGDDRLLGGGGQDVLIGGFGSDVLVGGPDEDRFVYKSVLESPVGAAGRDRINQFSSAQGDLIDLSGIDADADTAGDDSFTFIGTSGFSGSAGELRYVNLANNVIVSGDVDGDGTADFEIFVSNTPALSASDFVL